VLAFLARCFDVPVADGYGTTETGALAINGVLFDHVDYKLVDVPELGYTSPRGELLVRSAENTPGYYKDPEATAALFDGEYLRTGDVVEERAPREIVWLDRRANVTKLSQGQFVATTQLEELYASRSTVIDQIYLYANARHAFLLAVVVPRTAGDDVALRRAIREDLDRIAREAGRPAHEVPRDFVIERAPFTVANELVTESGKQNVRRLRERYAPVLDAMHAEIEVRQLSHEALADVSLDLASRVRAAVAVTLGLTVEDVANAPPELGFVGFGGDSLGALRFCKLVEDALGVKVAVASVLDRTASLAAIIDSIAKRASIAFEDVHAHAVVRTEELVRIVPDDLATLPPAHVPPRTVLLTGSTGFVGRMLALALAEHAHVICLVRGETARLRSAAEDAGVVTELDALIAGGRIEVVAGDLMRPDLGLAARDFAALAERVDAIVHAGALVNHALPYRHLFAPNVLGTRELARLALMRPGVAVCFLSSIGVPIQRVREVDSTEPGAGYVTSKWACEVMLEELHRRRGVPVAIVRCGNVAPHRDHPSALNWADNTNRLLHSIVATGLAPMSFYGGGPGRYDLVPLDAAVAAITTIAMNVRGLATYHVTSDDEVSLDTLLAWVESAGVQLERLPHAAWFAAWRAQLEALPAPVRARSAFATLDRWREPLGAIPAFDTASYRALRPSIVDEALVHRWVEALRER
jgi:fatty acid CoA ligase FadD9